MRKPGAPPLRQGKEIITRLAIFLRIAENFDLNNELVLRAIDDLRDSLIDALQTEKNITLELLRDFFYINHVRVRYTFQHFRNFDYLMQEFTRRSLGGLVFSDGIGREDLQAFARAFKACRTADAPYIALKDMMRDIEHLETLGLRLYQDDAAPGIQRTVKKSYFSAVNHLKTVMQRVGVGGRRIDVKKSRFVVNSLIDVITQDEKLLVGMTAIKDYDEYTYHHSVHVSILSVALGMRLGLNRRRISELGVAAFLHDVGKVAIPDTILNKPTSFSEEEWSVMRRHPLEGVRVILKSMRMDSISMRCATVCYEHHMNYDHSGYPTSPDGYELDLFSQIVTIADRFDAMTSARVYSRVPRAPETALRILLEGGGTEVDPRLIRMFISMVGIYPVGTLVALDTNEIGIVIRTNAQEPQRPRVRLLLDRSGNRIDHQIADLQEQGFDGAYRRSIRKPLDCHKYGINVSEYLLEDL
jgi:HD-GYP domain-containing protein (c-di-GMP phosphodiesterase class II)